MGVVYGRARDHRRTMASYKCPFRKYHREYFTIEVTIKAGLVGTIHSITESEYKYEYILVQYILVA